MEGGVHCVQKTKRTYAESSRKRLTLCMAMRAVGEEMMTMAWLCPAKRWNSFRYMSGM